MNRLLLACVAAPFCAALRSDSHIQSIQQQSLIPTVDYDDEIKSDPLKCGYRCGKHGYCGPDAHCVCEDPWRGKACNEVTYFGRGKLSSAEIEVVLLDADYDIEYDVQEAWNALEMMDRVHSHVASHGNMKHPDKGEPKDRRPEQVHNLVQNVGGSQKILNREIIHISNGSAVGKAFKGGFGVEIVTGDLPVAPGNLNTTAAGATRDAGGGGAPLALGNEVFQMARWEQKKMQEGKDHYKIMRPQENTLNYAKAKEEPKSGRVPEEPCMGASCQHAALPSPRPLPKTPYEVVARAHSLGIVETVGTKPEIVPQTATKVETSNIVDKIVGTPHVVSQVSTGNVADPVARTGVPRFKTRLRRAQPQEESDEGGSELLQLQ